MVVENDGNDVEEARFSADLPLNAVQYRALVARSGGHHHGDGEPPLHNHEGHHSGTPADAGHYGNSSEDHDQ